VQISEKILNESTQDLPIPLYHRLGWVLKNQILKGHWAIGDLLPTEIKLAKRYDVSRLTVRRAKALLESEGLITSVQGSGSRVTDSLSWRLKREPLSKLEDIIHYGQDTSFDLEEFFMTGNTPFITEHLRNTDDRFVFKIHGVRHTQKQPLSYNIYYIPYTFGKLVQIERLTDKPFLPQFEEMFGCEIVEGRQSIYPGRATRKVAEKLKTKKGALILSVDTVYVNEAHTPVYFIQSSYRSGYKHEIIIKRTERS
jgi:GntR family transcriptional regulator